MMCLLSVQPMRLPVVLRAMAGRLRLAVGLALVLHALAAAAEPVGGEFIVKFREGRPGRPGPPTADKLQPEVSRRFLRLGVQHVRLNDVQAEAIEQLRRDPDILYVEPNYVVEALPGLTPSIAAAAATIQAASASEDPLRPAQWALADINAPAAWQITTGNPETVVAVIDTGVNYRHEDLAGNMWRNPGEIPGNGIDDDGNGRVDDVYGIDVADDARGNDGDPFDEGARGYFHGSLVAGIIGARAHNGVGMTGLNWSVQLMAVRAIRASNAISLADELEAIDYLLMMKQRGVNIRVVNMSYGGIPFSRAEHDALEALNRAGIVVCAAAGNAGRNNDVTPLYPASHASDGLISVAASDAAGTLAQFPDHRSSHYGRTSVDLAAPGLEILSTFGPRTNAYDPAFFGTSAAAPHVAGAAALLLSVNPAATPVEVRQALIDSVDRLPALAGKLVSQGRLNIARALEHPLIAVGPPKVTRHPLPQSVVLSNQLTLEASVFGQHPLTTQWFVGETPLPGATNLALNVGHSGFPTAGDYRLVVSNSIGMATSEVATVTVLPLRIAAALIDQSIRVGGAARFTANVTGPKPLYYQWRFNGVDLPAETNATLKRTRIQLAHAGEYDFTAGNAFGAVTSTVARLTVLMKPVITFPPLSQSVAPGGSVTVGVGFDGNPGPFTVLWRKGNTIVASNVVAGREDFFSLPNVQAEHRGSWKVTVRNPASPGGTSKSFSIKLVTDADQDGLPDAWETAIGYPTNIAMDATADLDRDGLRDRDEYLAGTQPTNALSLLAILTFTTTSNGAALTFAAVPNHTYTVERQSTSAGLTGDWRKVVDVLAARTNRLISVVDTSAPPAESTLFYRVVTPRQPGLTAATQ